MTRLTTAVACRIIAGTMCCVAPSVAAAQNNGSSLTRISLDDLLQLEVTSVSKKEQKLSEAPSAIFVLTQEDLARAGVTTVAEALRLVPGLEVARVDANKWAVSARGFNGRFADKMLVLMDGRSVYTPLFSGVYWDIQDTMLADIDRIEVIRGPGAALWGANAVNGVINIITKSAEETYGALVSVRSGMNERAVLEARYGGALGERSHYRGFMKYLERGPFVDESGVKASDNSDLFRAGFRVDQRLSPDDVLRFDVQGYRGSSNTTYGPGSLLAFDNVFTVSPAEVAGGHVLGKWTHALAPRSELSLQAYWDFTSRNDSLLDERRYTADIEFQHHTGFLPRQDIVWGAGYRATSDRIIGSPTISFSETSRTDELVNMFVQSEVTVIPGRLRVTGGVKLEHNSYTGWEWQPDARALVMLDRRQTVWAAFSRAVRTPSRAETDITMNAAPVEGLMPIPLVVSLRGNPAFRSETLRANEVGYRIQPTSALSFDVAAFANQYDHLRTFEPLEPFVTLTPSGPFAVAPLRFDNRMSGKTRGLEVVTRWEPASIWRLEGTYTLLDVTLRHHPDSLDTYGIEIEDASPQHQARMRSSLALTRRVDVDATVAYVGAIEKQGIARYTQVDARLAWRIEPDVTLAMGGLNLFNARHLEFASTLGERPTQVPRSLYVSLNWLF